MSWRDWGHALGAVSMWKKKYELVDLVFDVEHAGAHVVGSARLTNVV